MKYFKEHYDVVIIGASLSGLSAGITLLNKNKNLSVLVLEQHNLPGGVATSFMRGGVEFEASLHEMMSISTKECPLKVRRFLEENNCYVDWIRINEAYRLITDDIDVVVHPGMNGDYSIPSKDIADACDDKDGSLYKKLMKFFKLCLKVYRSSDALTIKQPSKLMTILKHYDLVSTAGYSALEVMEAFKLPKEAIDILSAYWMYLGTPIEDTPFSVYAYLLADYLGYGPYVPRHFSHEMSVNLAESLSIKGAQIEYKQRVDKILVRNKKVKGVRLSSGTVINCDYVISGAYPNTVYGKMIEPSSEVNEQMKKLTNSMELGVSCFAVTLLLDKDKDELGIKDYSVFHSIRGFDSKILFEDGKKNVSWDFLTCTCTNVVNKEASPKGTCIYSITYLPSSESYKDVNELNYEEYKNKQINHFLDEESKRLGVNLRDHILEIVVETPISVAHYTGAYLGGIYGYRHSMSNHVIARTQMEKDEQFISGLAFAGAHQFSGDGMAPAISNGNRGANTILKQMKRGSK